MTQREDHALTLSTLSPIHIGTGHDLDATRYVMDGERLYTLDPVQMMALLTPTQRQALIRLCDDVPDLKGPDKKRALQQTQSVLVQLQRFFHEHRHTLKQAAVDVRPVSRGMAHYYQSKLGIGVRANERARLEIAATLTNPFSHQPIVPGSTLKGVLRTAITNLNAQAVSDSLNQKERRRPNAAAVEKGLLTYQRVNEDPFSGLKITDAMPTRDLPRQLVFAQQISRKTPEEANAGQRSGGFYKNQVLLEVLPPFAVRALATQLTIRRDFLVRRGLTGDRLLSTLTLVNTFKAQNRFALPQLHSELDRLERQGIHQGSYCAPDVNWIYLMRQLLKHLETPLKQGQVALVRLGHYAGAESKTWDGLRHIKISPPGKTPLRFGSAPLTSWLAVPEVRSGQFGLPFGWALLESTQAPLDDDLLAPLQAASSGWTSAYQTCVSELAELRESRQHVLAQQRAQEEALAEMAREQEDKAAKRQQMTPAALAVDALKEQLANDQRFNINEPSGELRTLLNQAVAAVTQEADPELKATTRECLTACCQLWNVDRKKNKKIKALWQQLAE